jgi:HTH-type transcriptional regulator/antitoxin HigA
MMNPVKPIRTEEDYEAALAEIEPLFDLPEEPLPGTPEGDRLALLATLIEAYEREHYSISPPDPIAAIRFRMEQAGLTVEDLVPMIGRKNRVYEVLNGKRALSLAMIRKLHDGLRIPLESLVQPIRQDYSTTRHGLLA